MTNKRILVTGGAGSIGGALVRRLAPDNKIFVLDNNESETWSLCQELSERGYWVKPRIGDIRNQGTVTDLFEDFKPQIIFHAAAYKHVAPMETYPLEAIETNVLGTHNILHEARRWESTEKLVFISTDKAVNSTSVMGATKRLGEIMVRNAGFTVVRFGNVLGSRGSVFPIWQRQIKQGQPLTITDPDATRYTITLDEAVLLVLEAAALKSATYILDMGKPKRLGDLLDDVLRENKWATVKLIGLRPGEAKHERLMTEEEEKQAKKKGELYVL